MNEFLVLTGLFLGSVTTDALTTRAALRRCITCVELNPLARPFVRDDARLLVYVSVSSAGVIGLTAKARGEKVKGWWVPIVALTVGHTLFAIHNARLAR